MPYLPRIVLVAALVLSSGVLASRAEALDAEGLRASEMAGSFDRTVQQLPCAAGSCEAVRRCPLPCDPYRCQPERKRWRFGIAPYGWLSSVSGTAWADGDPTDFEVPFEKILERVNGGFQLHAEARYGKWYFSFDGTIANLGDVIERRFIDVEVELDQLILDLRVGYRVWRHVLGRTPGRGGGKPERTLDAYLYTGVRYFETTTKVDITLPIVGKVPLSDTSTYTDPLFGGRVTVDLGRRWSLALEGDAAALFNSESAMSWQTNLVVGYHVTRWMNVVLGYRVMGMDQTSGAGPTKSGAELVMHGPLLGVGFEF